jgi:hypothetical protein
MNKLIRSPGFAGLTDSEYKEAVKKEREAYRKRLEIQCPSKKIMEKARKLANEGQSCSKCVYGDENCVDACKIPHTSAYMEEMEIEPCCEGILLYLCKEAETAQALDLDDDDFCGFDEDYVYDDFDEDDYDDFDVTEEIIKPSYFAMEAAVNLLKEIISGKNEKIRRLEEDYGISDCGINEKQDKALYYSLQIISNFVDILINTPENKSYLSMTGMDCIYSVGETVKALLAEYN